MSADITKDPVYEPVPPDDFEAMLDLDRYGARTDAFDRLISASRDHDWNPLDAAYLDFDQPFDMAGEPLLPETMVAALQTEYVGQALSDPARRTAFINAAALRVFSTMLHGEQGALNLSASLCHVLKDQGAQEFAANQAREEARHVTAFARYVKARWGRPAACSPVLQALLTEIIASPEVYKKVVGMQIVVEGLAMGAFGAYYKALRDPLGKRLLQLVMTDESFHHRFGKMWADRTLPQLSDEEREQVEDWAAHCFSALVQNLLAPASQRGLYEEFGLDPDRADAEFRALLADPERRQAIRAPYDIFRVLAKTLLNGGVISERTRPIYTPFVDLDALAAEGEGFEGQAIAEEGARMLAEINTHRRRGQAVAAAE